MLKGISGRLPSEGRSGPRIRILFAAGLALALLSACGSNQALLTARVRTEAEQLQEACRRTSLATEETQKADSYVSAAAKHEKDGEAEAAQREAELATVLYRLALARRELAETQAAVDALKTALAKDQDQLQTYQQVLEEVKTKRTP